MLEYLIIFLIYSWIGASFEHTSYYFDGSKKSLDNPVITGFPLYGIGAFVILYLDYLLKKHELQNIVIRFLLFATVITIIEFVVGIAVGAGPTSYTQDKNGDIMVSAWNYSSEYPNYLGIISLKHFALWGIASIGLVTIHPYIYKFVMQGLYCKQ